MWKDISTAPKDGTEVIVRFVDKGEGGVEVANAWWNNSWRKIDYSLDAYKYFSFCDITHWMPLPELPENYSPP